MDVRIGVTNTPKEIEVELPDGADTDRLAGELESVLSSGGMWWLTDRRGRRIGVPAERVAYVELDAGSDDRRVGFGAGLK